MGMPYTLKGKALKNYRAVKSVGKLLPTPAKKLKGFQPKKKSKVKRRIRRGGYRK